MEGKLQEFISLTGADPEHARDMLEGHHMDVESAVKMYRFMQNSTLPPAGPRKNQEPKRVNVASSGGGMPLSGHSTARPLGKLDGHPIPGNPGATSLQSQPAAPPSPNAITRKLKRGMSKTSENIGLINKARDVVLHDIVESTAEQHFIDTPEYTFILPDITVHSEDFRAFLYKDLIEMSTLVSLEQAGRLNWWADMGVCQRLLPLATTGDGNCLLHAASLGMWGFHDRLLTLRKALFRTLTSSSSKGALWRRWRWHQTQVNKESGLVYSEVEWQTEWDNLLKLASATPRTTPGSRASCCASPATKGLMERDEDGDVFYESLEELHVFILAHVLRRAIIVVADTILKDSNGEALAPIPFGGIYLPLECDPKDCHRSPLLLTYDASHFSALVAMDQDTSPDDKPPPPVAIPLMDPEFNLLSIHYMVDPGPNFTWNKDENDVQKTKNLELAMEDKLNLIRRYLNIQKVSIANPSTEQDNGSLPRSRTNSCSTGSIDSDDSACRDKDKSKMAKQMQTVAKSFGSIGKTVSKKLKKNFGGISKAMKQSEEKEKGKYKRKSSVGSVTQSTKVSSLTVELLGDRDHILCSRLSNKRAEYQDEMVKNYLLATQERFKMDRQFRVQQGVEMRQKAEARRHSIGLNNPMQCINPDCTAMGSPTTSYLCEGCFEKQKQQALTMERGNNGAMQKVNLPATVTGTRLSQVPERPDSVTVLERQDTVCTSGHSKFYTFFDESHALEKQTDPLTQKNTAMNNIRAVPPMENYKMPLELARSSFYVDKDKDLSSLGPSKPEATTMKKNLPPGAAYVVNNLRTSTANQDRQKNLMQNRTQSTYAEQEDEPLMKTESEKSRARPAAFKVKTESIENAFRDKATLKGVEDNRSSKPKAGSLGAQQMCLSSGCQFYGTESSQFLCSSCYKERQRTLAYQANQANKQTRM